MFSSKEVKPSMKAGLVMAAFTLLTLYTFGFAGNAAIVTFQLSDKGHALSVPDFAVSSSAFAILVGGLMGVITLVATALTILKRVVPMWLSLIFGLLWISTLLGWLAAGNVVPVSFILSNAVVLAVPIILGALGGVISERVGVVNIAIEGQLLTGAFVASVIGSVTDNLWLGVAAAAIASAILSMALASLAIKYLVDQIIIGVLINLLVIGVTNFLYSQWLANDGQNVNYPGTFDVLSIPILSEIPIIGQALFANRVTVYLCFVLVPLVWFMLFKTKLGLRARAVGEHPLAADTVGINVARTRFWWVTTGGAIAGIGGAALSIGNVGAFGREMSGGLGFIALAVVILGRWQPFYVSAAALLFGFAIIMRVWANQVSPGIPTDFITMVPYLVTLIAVTGFAGKVRPPAASGQPYTKG
ncbi:MAG: ABC transporter permease [Microbacteriaceae bacterium]|nr:ABC transporter permease [Microbacteriaceae bacterium]